MRDFHPAQAPKSSGLPGEMSCNRREVGFGVLSALCRKRTINNSNVIENQLTKGADV